MKVDFITNHEPVYAAKEIMKKMTLKEQLHQAIEIVLIVNMGQFDTHNDCPYIEHPYRVMNERHLSKIAGMLHDVVEDSEWTLEQLTAEGFSQEIVAAVDALTRREGEPYEESIRRGRPMHLLHG